MVEAIPTTVFVDDGHVVVTGDNEIITGDHLEWVLWWWAVDDGFLGLTW